MIDINNVPKNGYSAVSTFSGMGGSSLGLRLAGFDVKAALEFIPEAANTYKANNPNTFVMEADIRDISGKDILNRSGLERGKVHILEGSPPCLIEGQPIITINGYQNIEDVEVGTLVYTHLGRYRSVMQTSKRNYKGRLYSFRINGFSIPLSVTEEHPLYVCRGGKRDRGLKKFEWVPAKDITMNDYVVFNCGSMELKHNEEDYTDLNLAKFLGNFMLCGFVDKKDKITFDTEDSQLICDSIRESAKALDIQMEEYLFDEKLYMATFDQRFIELCRSFGDKGDRHIPEGIINSSFEYLREFVEPLLLANKNKNPNMYFRATSSLNMFMGYQRILMRLNSFPNIYTCVSKSKDFIYYALTLTKSEISRLGSSGVAWFKDSEFAFLKIEEIVVKDFKGLVYNIEVDEDNSYCNHLFTVHNCSDFSSQHFSSSGKEIGKVKVYSSTRQRVDDLFFEFSRVVGDIDPYVFIAENVESLLDEDKRVYLDSFIQSLTLTGTYGYNVRVFEIDFSDFGVPQQRERIIFMGVRKDLNILPVFPTPINEKITTREAIEDLINMSPDMEMTELEKKYARLIPVGSGTDYIDMLRNKYGLKIMKFNHRRDTWNRPHPTLLQNTRHLHNLKNRWLTVLEAKRLHTIPDDFILTGTTAQQYERIGRAVPPYGMYHIAKCIKEEILDVLKERGNIV